MARVFVVSGGPTVFAEAGTPVSVIAGFSSGNARYIQGRPISDEVPGDGEVLSWDEALGEIVWAAGGGGGGGGDATSIRGFPVTGTDPTEGQGLILLSGIYTPVDLATQAELDAHTSNTSNPHSVTKAQVGLSLVENTALSTWPGSANITTVGVLVSGEVPWGLISGEPTTLAGYGITDATSDAELAAWPGSANITTVGTLTAGAVPTTLLTGNMPDARIVQSNITQHQAALSIAWSQISSFSGSSLAQLATRNASDLEGTTLASTIVTSSLTTVGILGNLTVGTATAGCYLDNNGSTQAVSTTFVPEVVNNLGRFACMTLASSSVSSANSLGQFRWTITQADPSALKSSFSLQVNTGDNLQDAITISDARAVALSGGTLVLGALAASTGSHFEVQLATGASTITPVVERLRTTTTSQAWVFGAANYWAAWEAYSDDNTTPPGASVRCRMSVHAENSSATLSGMAFWTGPTGGPTVALTLNSDLTANFTGAIQRAGTQVVNTRRTGWTTVPTGTLDRTTFVSDSVTLPNLAARVAALIIDLHASAGHGLIGA